MCTKILECAVHPDRQGTGAGQVLWDTLRSELNRLGAQRIRTLTREDHATGPGFLSRRGFTPGQRYFPSALELATFDASSYAPLQERLSGAGVRIPSLAELRQEGTPELHARTFTP
ncbi:GNAT family N-acetyltransferase [Deinococcus hopiensis]|uniref:GNAT family N-acetyltransferase n=1 Tax=Deinococcus hopiensis TaxID=309885 RepID=UPI001FE4C433|nr:GNAT family N-acetyltransferase [Deinococcus hopiensis]